MRRERELRAVSLQDISAATKIQLRFLEALEGDHYDQLPPMPFVVGFLRAYAQCLSLQSEEIIAAYHARHGLAESHSEGPRPLAPYAVEQPVRPESPATGGRTGWRALGVCGAIVVGLVLYVLWQKAPEEGITGGSSQTTVAREVLPPSTGPGAASTSSQTPSSPAERSVPPPSMPPLPVADSKSSPLPAAVAEAGGKAAGGAMAERSAEQTQSVTEATGQLVLQATAVEDTWLRVEIDGDKRQEMLLASGKNVRWEAKERFVITIGNARGTRLTLNGKDIQLPSTVRGNVVRDFLVTRTLLH
jgi:cytoskeleton protein RodZ